MGKRLGLLGILLCLLGGCTGPHVLGVPIEDASCAATLPACMDATVHPPVLPPDPGWDGAHPLDFYVQAALARNPEVQARERRVAAQAAVVPQVTALPDPMLSNSVWPITDYSPQTAAGRMPYTLMVSQQFPWFGKLHLRGEVAQREKQIALTQLAETQLKVIEDVKIAYYDIAFNQQAIKITEANEQFLRQYIQVADNQYRVQKKASQQDVLRAEVELRRLEDLLIQLRQQLKAAQADLAKLLSIPPETNVQAADAPALPSVPEHVERLYTIALQARPELQGRFQAILRDQQKVELAELNYYPDAMLGASWSAITKDDALARTIANGHDNIGLLVSINVPIWHQKLAAGVQEARDRSAESARLYDAARDDTFRMIRRLTVQARALEQEIDLYRREGTGIIAKAEHTLRVADADYRVQKVDALTVLDDFTQLLRFRIQLVRLETTLGQVLASLERAVGVELAKVADEPAPLPRQVE